MPSGGVHGVEGFAGSAIQIAWLESFAGEKHPTIVLVHAVNPYGMANGRRFDQSNVDLNRNAILDFSIPELQRNSQLYQPFDESLFAPRRAPSTFDLYFGIMWKGACAIYKHGYANLKKAMVTGQYMNPKGLFYGGKELQPSHEVLYNFINDTILPREGPVTWVDVHTGLGKIPGQDTLIISNEEKRRLLPTVFVGASIQDNQVTAGYDWVVGRPKDFYSTLFQDSWIFTQEFGTIKSVLVARALVLENMAYFYSQEQNDRYKALLRGAFYPRTATFRSRVLIRGWTVLAQALERSGGRYSAAVD